MPALLVRAERSAQPAATGAPEVPTDRDRDTSMSLLSVSSPGSIKRSMEA